MLILTRTLPITAAFLFCIFISAQAQQIKGTVTDANSGETLPGVNILVKGTSTGASTNADGNYELTVESLQDTLVVSFVGYQTQEVPVQGRTEINISLQSQAITGEEMVVVGYGTQERRDLTGSIESVDMEAYSEEPDISILQSLRGSVPGLQVDQATSVGEEPNLLIRGKSTLAGDQSPLIVLDGVIYRGNLNDLNPANIESIDVLKDASATAIYGSQATNGVILLTTTKGKGADGTPTFTYSSSYSLHSPVRELIPPGPEGFYEQTEASDILFSRTEESGYLEHDPAWDITDRFSVNQEIEAYQEGRTTDWYSKLTNDYMYTQEHNLSLANNTESNNYVASLGYTDQKGYMLNEGYKRINARINLDNNIRDWLKMGVQSFMTVSDYSGAEANPSQRYIEPYATDRDANGERKSQILAGDFNPMIVTQRDDFDKRLTLFGNVYAQLEIPFIKGLSYKANFANNYKRIRMNQFESYAVNFQGRGEKEASFRYDWSSDHIVSYDREFNNIHDIDVTLVYGVEKLQNESTTAIASVFSNDVLGYNRLQSGDSEQQQAISGAWEESSLYTMGRIFYGYNDKYLLTGTIRRDGYSGFGENNKYGVFPSVSVAWRVSEESFVSENFSWLDQLKIRASYGSVGNRTIGRYQTLARISGGYQYITLSNTPLFAQNITSLESPNLKWETTTGTNLGIDFGILSNRISGSIDYYNKNTTDLFYRVDIPGISRFEEFPDNLGKLHNHGLEMNITSLNVTGSDFTWSTTFNFSRNRNELKELLGFDLNGDGQEDDLVSEGLFIGESIDAIYDYEIDGKWQVNDEIPPGYDLGAHKTVDLNDDGTIEPEEDRTIIGYEDPSYRFGIQNSIQYKNWSLRFFINSIQGGDNRYLGEDDFLDFQFQNTKLHFRNIFPEGVDFWKPENPNARYQRPNISTSSGIRGTQYAPRSFVRLQNISLSYNLPAHLIERIGLQNASVTLGGKNLVTLTEWNGWDPETNQTITRDGRPLLKSYSMSVNIHF